MTGVDESGIEGRSVVVTGGGSGIGAACAERLAADGARVTICGRTRAKLDEVVERVQPRVGEGGAIRAVAADVTSEDDVVALYESAAADGPLRGVVANAGGGGAIAPLHLQEHDEFVRVLHLNVVGTMLLAKHAVPRMVAAGGGSFVGMSSVAAAVTHPYFGAYTVSKAGIDALVRNAADEYGPAGVRFNAVRPGFVATEIMALIPRDSEVYASYLANTPLAGVAEPDDVAQLVRFLVGDESRWVTGQVVGVDGGHSLRRGPDFGSFLEPVLGRDVMLAKAPAPDTG
jgi:7-alpha-hydroxysteroid dehydrogenase